MGLFKDRCVGDPTFLGIHSWTSWSRARNYSYGQYQYRSCTLCGKLEKRFL